MDNKALIKLIAMMNSDDEEKHSLKNLLEAVHEVINDTLKTINDKYETTMTYGLWIADFRDHEDRTECKVHSQSNVAPKVQHDVYRHLVAATTEEHQGVTH